MSLTGPSISAEKRWATSEASMKTSSAKSSTDSVRAWRQARRAKQLCLLCDNVSPSKNHCDACAVRINPQIRRRLIPDQLKDVDWTKSLTAIARELNVHRITARKYRQLCQRPSSSE